MALEHSLCLPSPLVHSILTVCIALHRKQPADRPHALIAAYRKTALEHHPDKAGAGIVDEAKKRDIEERFQQINDAYETLSDAIDDFDDSLPSSCGPLEFFKV